MLFLRDFFDNGLELHEIIHRINKDNAVALIKQMMAFSKQARREGLLALEDAVWEFNADYMSDSVVTFTKKMLSYIFDSYDPEIAETMACNYIAASHFSYDDTVQAVLIANGVLMIQRGDNPKVLYQYLASMLGIGVVPDLED